MRNEKYEIPRNKDTRIAFVTGVFIGLIYVLYICILGHILSSNTKSEDSVPSISIRIEKKEELFELWLKELFKKLTMFFKNLILKIREFVRRCF